MKFFRVLRYRWHDWRHRDVPLVDQRVNAMKLLPKIHGADRMRTRIRLHAKCRSLKEWVEKHEKERAS